jgi:hypothetical protein
MITLLVLQLLSSVVKFAWDANTPDPTHAIGYQLTVDNQVFDVGPAITAAVTLQSGPHQATVAAYFADVPTPIPGPSSAPLTFTVAAGPDPCAPPLGAHAPAVFLTSITQTTGRPGSRSLLNYQLGGPDTVTVTAVQVDGVDQTPMFGGDLRAFGSMWFTQPASGTHTLGLRIQTSFGCGLTRGGLTLVVK